MVTFVLSPQNTPSKDRIILLEPNAWKLARSVLRGEGSSNTPALPDYKYIKTILRFPTMTLTQQRKQELISEYQVHETDTGSADLQIAVLTERINKLTAHLKANKKDHSSRRGLLKMIGRRKGLLSYIQKEDYERYQKLIARLGIRR
jgi:small subunit ribosomal protein S15